MARKSLEEIYGVSTTQQNTVDVPSMQIQNQPKRRSLEEIYGTPQQTSINQSFDQPTITQPEPTDFASKAIVGTKENIFDPFASRFSNIDYSGQGIGSNLFQSVGALAGGLGDVVGNAIVGAGKMVLPTAAENVIGGAVTGAVQGVTSAIPEEVKQSFKDWQQAHPEAAANLGAFVDIASLFPAAKGVSIAAKTARGADNAVGLARTTERIIQGADQQIPVYSGGKMVQQGGSVITKPLAQSVLQDIGNVKVKSYKELDNLLEKKSRGNTSYITEELKKDPLKYGKEYFNVNKAGLQYNPVVESFKSLKELAVKKLDTNLLEELKPYELKLAKRDFTPNDVNELSKVLSRNILSFRKDGAMLKNTNAAKAENLRKELKDFALRDRPDLIDLDKQTSNILATRAATKRMVKKVNDEVVKAQDSGMLARTVSGIANVADFFSARLMSSTIRQIARNAGIDATSVSDVMIEKELAKNLRRLQDAVNSKNKSKMKEYFKSIGFIGVSQAGNQINEPDN